MRELDPHSFATEVLETRGPVVVDFWAPWCRPCRSVTAILEALEAADAARATFAKVDIDAHPELAARYAVLSVPTTILFAGGEPQATVVGARPRSHFERTFAPWLDAATTA